MKQNAENDLLFLINTTSQVEKLLFEKNQNKLENANLFFHSILIRTNSILKSVLTLYSNSIENKIALYILLRPLTLDYLYLYYLIFVEMKDKDIETTKVILDNISNNCLKDGVKEYHNEFIRASKYFDKKERIEVERNFKKIFDFAIKSCTNNFSSIKFFEKDYTVISSKSIDSKVKIKQEYYEQLLAHYNFFSKYDHNTGVGYFDSIATKGYTKTIDNCIGLLKKSFIHLLFLIDLYNNMPEVRAIYNEMMRKQEKNTNDISKF